MSVDLRLLHYFVVVAEELHFGRAAGRLHIAQPPLSQAIRSLEDSVGARLLERTTRRVNLTPAGEVYLHHARDVLARVERAGEDARRLAAGLEGRIVVGCVGSATYSILPQFARALHARLPSLDLAVRGEMLTAGQVEALRDGSIDVGLMRRPADTSGLVLTTIRRDRLLLAVPDEHRLAHRKRARMTDLTGETVLTHPGGGRSAMFALVTAAAVQAGAVPAAVQEVAETSTLLTFVAAGLGVAILPEPARALAIDGVAWIPLQKLEPVELLAARREAEEPRVMRALQVLEDFSRPPGPARQRSRR